MSTAFGTKVSGQLITSAWANQVGSAINALEDGNALTLAQILAKFTGTPSAGKFLDYTGAWNTPPLTTDAAGNITGTTPGGSFDVFTVGNEDILSLGRSFGVVDTLSWAIGGRGAGSALAPNRSGIYSDPYHIFYNVTTSSYQHRFSTAGIERTRLSATLLETNRISLGGTIGSSVDPGAGGIAITGRLVFAGAGTASATTSQIFGYAANSHIIYNTPSTYAHWFRINNVDKFIIGYSPIFGYGADNWMLGGIKSNGTSQIYYDCTSAHYWRISGENVAAIGGSGFIEGGRVSLGGIIGSSVDPGAGGLALTGNFYISTTQTPASAAATGTVGQIAWDSGFVYVCTATNTWKRAAIATW